ncbi:unnamed protein product [Acidithrix sp. C25]|nr:unnamed protein product [Acidithrix sp. C25]
MISTQIPNPKAVESDQIKKRFDPMGRFFVIMICTLSALVAISATTIALLAITRPPWHGSTNLFLAIYGLKLATDPLSGVFLLISGSLGVMVIPHLYGYLRRNHLPTTTVIAIPIFIFTMALVPLANSTPTFFFFWELMALASVPLVAAHPNDQSGRRATFVYLAMTQLGAMAILVALAIISASHPGTPLAGLSALSSRDSNTLRSLAFLLALIGFGSKAGIVPFHIWLPKAHPQAPGPASALMSGAMVSLGIYGIIRFCILSLGTGAKWWAITLIVFGSITAIYGILQASVNKDLKVLLAYSTAENMGLALIAIGLFQLFRILHLPNLAAEALGAGVLILVAHGLFKGLAFLVAGSIQSEIGITDLDQLGGLAKIMPVSTVGFGIAALSASGLPFGSAFIGEWLLLQTIIHLPRDIGSLVLIGPIALGVVALTAGLSVLTMVKAFGIGFLGTPRSKRAGEAHESSTTMSTSIIALMIANLGLAFDPGVINFVILHLSESISGVYPRIALGSRISITTTSSAIFPSIGAALFIVGAIAIYLIRRLTASKRPQPLDEIRWGCGAKELTPKMQYTATSFAEPLERIFSDILVPRRDIETDAFDSLDLIVKRIDLRESPHDAIETALWNRLARALDLVASQFRRFHNGSLIRYLMLGGLGFAVVMVVTH